MSKLFWATATLLLAIIAVGAIFNQPQSDNSDKSALVELTLSNMMTNGLGAPVAAQMTAGKIDGLPLLFTPCLSGAKIPESINGVRIIVWSQDQLNEESLNDSIMYVYFDKMVMSKYTTVMVDVSVAFGYRTGFETSQIRTLGDETFYCTRQPSGWVIDRVANPIFGQTIGVPTAA
jgi:hypothetical protein